MSCRLTKLYNLDHCGLSILIPNGVFDALVGTPNCGPVHAGTVDHHRGVFDAVVRGIGGFVAEVEITFYWLGTVFSDE